MGRRAWVVFAAAGLTLALVQIVPAHAMSAVVPVRAGRSLSLTSPTETGYFVRIWLSSAISADADARSAEEVRYAHIFIFQGCDPVEDNACLPTGTDYGEGPVDSTSGDGPDVLTGAGAVWDISFTAGIAASGAPHEAYECDYWASERCGPVVYRDATVVANVWSPKFGLVNAFFAGQGRLYVTDGSLPHWSAGTVPA